MVLTSFENPFELPGRWWKGNLHTHTTVSDGELPPAETAAAYRELGYDFLAITDHVSVMEPFEPPGGLLVIPGAEYHTFGFDPPCAWHFVCLGPRGTIDGVDGPVAELHASLRENSSFYFVAHPYWSNVGEHDLRDVAGVPAMEVYNTVCERAIDRGYSDQAWDYALAFGERINALAVDDCHKQTDMGRGWIMLRAQRLDLRTLFDALRRGLYYSSSGPEIHDLRLNGNVVRVRCSPCRLIKFMARSADGKCFTAADNAFLESAAYELKGTEVYLRVQVEDAAGGRAYTNPIYVQGAGED